MTLGVTDITGYTASNINGDAGAFARARAFTAGTSETITRLEFYYDAGYEENSRVKLFLANGAGTRLALTEPVECLVAGGSGWRGADVTGVAVVSGQQYFIGVYIDPAYGYATGRLGIYRSAQNDSWYDSASGSYSAPPSAFTFADNANYSSIAIRGIATGGGGTDSRLLLLGVG